MKTPDGKMPQSSYSSLSPWREAFRSGVPVLCYHKLGPLPPGVKMPSLYVSAELFAWQLRQLSDAGFSSAPLGDLQPSEVAASPRVAITFDDGSRTLMRHALPVLQETGFRAIVYLVAGALGGTNHWDVSAFGEAVDPLMDEAEVRDWLAAGHSIGAHTITHPRLTRIPAAQARSEIADSRRRLEDRFGVAIEHFCYPYGKWSKSVRALVEDAGYRTAVTLDGGVNAVDTDPFALRRLSVGHPARNFRNLVGLGFSGFPLRFFRGG